MTLRVLPKANVISVQSYLINAYYAWIVDNQWTPYVIFQADLLNNNAIPKELIQHNEIVLNLSPVATRNLQIDREGISFKICFQGVPHEICAPIDAVLAIYAHENNEGIFFAKAEKEQEQEISGEKSKKKSKKSLKKSFQSLFKSSSKSKTKPKLTLI